ncbi:rod shape-determining protein MreC [Streptococcus iners]|uniref:Cell shape-determining protein MreC n=1 Tax=Streptococcus iners TaxID=3028084 RepID=A0AA97AEA1_9STRE|nr:rod shape-determining protein MreC [Streptococcus sp. 29887]MCK4026350.1 rod shape-determining protein MreC [Streptococcus suis]WNY51126.1 rod shape-determining protein MreC [Streptococcus sp. 29887]
MNKFSKLLIAISVFLLLSFSLLFLTFSKGAELPFVNSSINLLVRPIQSFLSVPTRFFSDQQSSLSHLFATYEENKELKKSLLSVQDFANENASLKAENETLRKSLEMASSFPEKGYIAGSVLVRTPASWSEQVTIDVGQNMGISENALVVANGGLVGVVSSIEENSSVVKLFTNADDFTKLPVKISTDSKDIYGILAGFDLDSNSFIINQLNATDDIAVGSNVVTSDLAGATPANVQIGKVRSVKASSNNLNRELYVEPSASFSSIYSVLVVGQSDAQ